MKLVTTFLLVMVFLMGSLSDPVFVLARSTCYVDEDASDDGDGSDDEPYQKITKALDKDCKEVIVTKGTYKDDITIGSDVKIVGDNRDDVIITGKVTMKDGSEIKKVTIADSGVDVADRASVTIRDAKIKGANIGIETVGNGTLTVKDVILYGNRKAMYLQKGKNVKITNSEVYDNDEEGIDIRANVDGVISGNSIHNNGESGIEVIVGKSDLKIHDNKIKKNGSSGIAAQYYKSSSKLGGVTIKDNTITGNKNFGITCKAPSGGNPGVEYWTKSIQMTANKVYSNKDGEFSPECYFDDDKITDATKTKKQKEQEQEAHEKAEQKVQHDNEQKAQEAKVEKEKKEGDEKRKEQEQIQLRENLQREKNLQRDIEGVARGVDELYAIDTISQEKIKSRPSFFMFFVGPDYKELRKMALNIAQYEQKIEQINNTKNNITDAGILTDVDKDIMETMQKRDDVRDFVQQYNDTFSFFGWIFKKNT